jgi:hypothetical protein|tara:strand:+ start:654 stop:1037 length:384 start_codon:yes stop_codon:yes gene_type:complete
VSDLRKIQVEEMERCREWIEGALKVYDTHDFEDIVVGVLDGKFDFWSAPDACIVTEFITFPKYLALNVFLAGGNLKTLMVMRKTIENFAKETGCKKLVGSGRKGWARIFTSSKDVDGICGYMYAKEL